ncbi:MAG: pyridoxamine kinase [Ruminococcaceae bacterium]|nr:pyridoxamine kinase [Oscillospiraceae bacterium]
MTHNHQKKIAVVNDFCGFGRCSLTVSLPIISALKLQCCPLPTSVFSNHTEFDHFFCTDYTEQMESYIGEWDRLGLVFEGILTGFLASEKQIEIVRGFFERFKRSDTIVVMDPVMGDHGKLYPSYSPALAGRMQELLSCADILTPNLTEACILAGADYRSEMNEENLTAICLRLSKAGPKRIVISGLNYGEDVGNFVFEAGKNPVILKEKRVGVGRAGTGDVFSSIIAADAVNGKPFADSVRHASTFIAKALHKTVELDLPVTDGVCFEDFLAEIGDMG